MTKFLKMLAAENLVDQAAEQQEQLDAGTPESVSAAVDFQAEIDAIKAETQDTATNDGDGDLASTEGGEGSGEGEAGFSDDVAVVDTEVDPAAGDAPPAEGEDNPSDETPSEPSDDQPTEQPDEQEQEHTEPQGADEQAQEEVDDGLEELSAAAEGLAQTLRGAVAIYERLESEHKVGHVSAAREAMAGIELNMIGSAHGIHVKMPASESNLSSSNIKNAASRVVAFIRDMLKRFVKWATDFKSWVKAAIRAYQETSSKDFEGKMGALDAAFDKMSKQLNPDEHDAKLEVALATTYKLRGMGPGDLTLDGYMEKVKDCYAVLSAFVNQETLIRLIDAADRAMDAIEGGVANGHSFAEISNEVAALDISRVFDVDFSSITSNASKYMQPSKGTGIVFSNLPGDSVVGFTVKPARPRNLGDMAAIIRSIAPVTTISSQPADFKFADAEEFLGFSSYLSMLTSQDTLIKNKVAKDLQHINSLSDRATRLYDAMMVALSNHAVYTVQEVGQILDLLTAINQEAVSRISSVYIKAGDMSTSMVTAFTQLHADAQRTYATANYIEAERKGTV